MANKKFILFILVVFIWALICSSAPIQDNGNELKNQGAQSSPCFDKHIAKSYFRHHESLVDSDFQEYLSHNLSPSSEKVFPRLLNMDRRLIGEGSHRRLSSAIRFSIRPDLNSDFSSRLCEVIIIERLPSGVFADPFELEHILQREVLKDVSVFGDINVELPSFRSNRSIVEIHLDMNVKSSGKEIVQELKIELPLHARYPPLEESGYSKVVFGVPDVLLRCMALELSPATQSCSLARVVTNGDLQLNPVIWLIPAGIKAHATLVSVVTFASASLSAIFMIIVSLKQSQPVSGERLKQT